MTNKTKPAPMCRPLEPREVLLICDNDPSEERIEKTLEYRGEPVYKTLPCMQHPSYVVIWAGREAAEYLRSGWLIANDAEELGLTAVTEEGLAFALLKALVEYKTARQAGIDAIRPSSSVFSIYTENLPNALALAKKRAMRKVKTD